MKVKFTETRIVDDFRKGTSNEERYDAGKVYDLPEISANRWIQRGAATADVKPARKTRKAPAPPVPPADDGDGGAAADSAGDTATV